MKLQTWGALGLIAAVSLTGCATRSATNQVKSDAESQVTTVTTTPPASGQFKVGDSQHNGKYEIVVSNVTPGLTLDDNYPSPKQIVSVQVKLTNNSDVVWNSVPYQSFSVTDDLGQKYTGDMEISTITYAAFDFGDTSQAKFPGGVATVAPHTSQLGKFGVIIPPGRSIKSVSWTGNLTWQVG